MSELRKKLTNLLYAYSPFLMGSAMLVFPILAYFGLRKTYAFFGEHGSLPNYDVGLLLYELRLIFLVMFPAAGCYLLLLGVWIRRLIRQKHERAAT
jgi:hypothetical protein